MPAGALATDPQLDELLAALQILLLARESGLLRLGPVSIDGTKIDATASKIRSVRYDRSQDCAPSSPPTLPS